MLVVFQKVLGLLIFMALGFVLSKFKIVNPDHSTIISKILIWVFLPMNIIRSFAENCTFSYINEHYLLILTSAAVVLVVGTIMHFVPKLLTRDKYQQKIYEYSLVIPNNGYMGYPISESLWGSTGLTNAMMFSMPLSLYIYTYGYCILTKKSFTPKKLINPVIISITIGVAAGLISDYVKIPEAAFDIMAAGSSCLGPCSMLLAGIVISEFKIIPLLTNYRTYITAVLRLLVIPLTAGGILKLVSAPDTVLSITVLLLSMPCGLNSVVFPKSIGEDCRAGAGMALITSVLSCATIPLNFFIFGLKLTFGS